MGGQRCDGLLPKGGYSHKGQPQTQNYKPKGLNSPKQPGLPEQRGECDAGFLKGLVTLGVLLRSNEFSKPLKLRKGKAPQGPHDPREVDPSRTAR